MEKEDILKIVRKKEEEEDFAERCARVDVCPKCGYDGLFGISDGHPFLTKYDCKKCNHTFLLND